LPTAKAVLAFIAASQTPVGKREIAKAFGLYAQDKIALKALLHDLARRIYGRRAAGQPGPDRPGPTPPPLR